METTMCDCGKTIEVYKIRDEGNWCEDCTRFVVNEEQHCEVDGDVASCVLERAPIEKGTLCGTIYKGGEVFDTFTECKKGKAYCSRSDTRVFISRGKGVLKLVFNEPCDDVKVIVNYHYV